MRRISLIPCFSLRGAPPKKPKSFPVMHAAYRPPESSDIDFSSLGLQYPVTNEPEVFLKRIGWSPPPQTAPSLPFQVSRAGPSRNIPVYTQFSGGRTKVITILKKCRGDISVLKSEMEKVVGKEVSIKPGKLVVDGNYHMRLKKWLIGLGF